MKTHFTIYEAKDGWRWRAKRAGRIVAESGEGYVKKAGCLRSMIRFICSIMSDNFTSPEPETIGSAYREMVEGEGLKP